MSPTSLLLAATAATAAACDGTTTATSADVTAASLCLDKKSESPQSLAATDDAADGAPPRRDSKVGVALSAIATGVVAAGRAAADVVGTTPAARAERRNRRSSVGSNETETLTPTRRSARIEARQGRRSVE